jgi:hypothetical protein
VRSHDGHHLAIEQEGGSVSRKHSSLTVAVFELDGPALNGLLPADDCATPARVGTFDD